MSRNGSRTGEGAPDARRNDPSPRGRAPEPRDSSRRSLSESWIETYYRIRSRESTPARTALSIALGVFIGCLPVYGFHLILCFGAARLFRLSGALAYLAAHINNPWTAPLLLYLEAGVGRFVLEGEWVRVSPAALREVGGLEIGRDLIVGAIVLGGALALLHGVVAFAWARRRPRDRAWSALVDRAARRYAGQGIRVWETVRGKLTHDPVYRALLRSDTFAGRRVVDLGSGRGLLLAALAEDDRASARPSALVGLEVDRGAVESARRALDGVAEIQRADLDGADVPEADALVLLDVLHYLSAEAQEALLDRCAERLAPGGELTLRESVLGQGPRTAATRAQERISSWLRGEWARPFCYRSEAEWRSLLEARGFVVESRPMSAGTPFANVLLRASRRGDRGSGLDGLG